MLLRFNSICAFRMRILLVALLVPLLAVSAKDSKSKNADKDTKEKDLSRGEIIVF